MFSSKFCVMFKDTFSYRTLPMAGSISYLRYINYILFKEKLYNIFPTKLKNRLLRFRLNGYEYFYSFLLPNFVDFSEKTEAATRGVLYKKVFLEISQNSQKNACASLFLNKVAGLRPIVNEMVFLKSFIKTRFQQYHFSSQILDIISCRRRWKLSWKKLSKKKKKVRKVLWLFHGFLDFILVNIT